MTGKNIKEDALFANIVYRLDYPEDKILQVRNKFYWFSGVSAGVVFLLSIGSFFLSRNNLFWIDTSTHSLFESYCGIISFIIAYVIYREYKSYGKRSNLFLFLGFFSMGIFDFFHAYSNYCTTLFVWFHSLSAFGGAFFFFLSAISVKNSTKDIPWLRHFLAVSGITLIIASAAAISKFPSPLPHAVTAEASHHTPVNFPVVGEFTTSTIVFNILSAIFFLFSGFSFLRYFRKTNDVLYHIFSLSAFLFFESELLFAFSRLWDPSWWYWHVIKLIIFAGLVIGLAHGFTKTFNELQESRRKLTKIVSELKLAYENLKNTRKELLESEKLASMGRLAATIAHEIRNPLGAIKNSAGIFKRHTNLSGEDKELLNIVEKEIHRLNRIITDFLDFAKPSPIDKSNINLNNLIDETLAILFVDNGASNPRIKIKKNYDRQLPDVLVDKNAIKQVLWNIFINADQAMPNGGSITVETHYNEQNNEIFLLIIDDGSGMSHETLSQVFQPFFSTKAKGTGLGLSIVQRIINQHGGRVYISSSIGQGTQVLINIPVIHHTYISNEEGKNAVYIDS